MGDGAKWRRSFGQEIYSPLLLAFAEQVKKKNLKIIVIKIETFEHICLSLVSCSLNSDSLSVGWR